MSNDYFKSNSRRPMFNLRTRLKRLFFILKIECIFFRINSLTKILFLTRKGKKLSILLSLFILIIRNVLSK